MMSRYRHVDGRALAQRQTLQAARRPRHAALAVSARRQDQMTIPLALAGLGWLALGLVALL